MLNRISSAKALREAQGDWLTRKSVTRIFTISSKSIERARLQSHSSKICYATTFGDPAGVRSGQIHLVGSFTKRAQNIDSQIRLNDVDCSALKVGSEILSSVQPFS